MEKLKDWWRRVRPDVLGNFVASLARSLGSTLKVEMRGWEEIEAAEGGKIVCGWHGKSFVAASHWRDRGYWVIISLSRDGEIQYKVFTVLGFRVIRGSTGRGGERALVESIKVLREGGTMAMTPDGPRGPSGVLQSGVLFMARKSGASLIPVGISAKRTYRANSWDRYMIPYPFSPAIMIFGQPVKVPKDAGDEEIEQIRQSLEARIHELEKEAEDSWRARP